MKTMRVGDREIGRGDVLVIAEIGVNHDGRLDRALALVESAARCGADAVKFQIFEAARLMHASAGMASYQQQRCQEQSAAAMLRRYELSEQNLRQAIGRAVELNLIPLATPFSPADVDVMSRLKLPAIKIASPDLVNLPLLQRAVATGRPLILSTGAATAAEIEATATWLQQCGSSFALLHCVSSYPTPAEQAHLCWISEMGARFPVPVGYSDHTTDLLSGALAVAAGAAIIEKHITYDRGASGPDHAASADEPQFARYVAQIRLAQKLCGQPGRRVLDIEQDVRRVSRQSLVACRPLPAGHVLQEQDLAVQRPGTGIPASHLPQAVGRRLRSAVSAGTMLQWEMLTDAA